jgi:hypothetical protein
MYLLCLNISSFVLFCFGIIRGEWYSLANVPLSVWMAKRHCWDLQAISVCAERTTIWDQYLLSRDCSRALMNFFLVLYISGNEFSPFRTLQAPQMWRSGQYRTGKGRQHHLINNLSIIIGESDLPLEMLGREAAHKLAFTSQALS